MFADTAYTTGLTAGFSLILAIGAQNLFVLKQGLRNEHVLAVVLTCVLSDSLLIWLGVGSFQQVLARAPWLDPVMRFGGAVFLFWYGAKSMHSAMHSTHGMHALASAPTPMKQVLGTCLALTWLNPHVYLDTVVLLGTLSTRFPGNEHAFAGGAITASVLFFSALGFGASYLRPLFAQARVWRVLEAMVALLMWWLAIRLVAHT